MGMKAVGAYLKGRREALELSPAEVAVTMKRRLGRNIATSTIWKIENGEMNAGSDLLFAFMEAVKASGLAVYDLMIGVIAPDRAEEMGRVSVMEGEELAEKLAHLPPEERQEWLERLEKRLKELS